MLVDRLRELRDEVAEEIHHELSKDVFCALVDAKDALNSALIAAGDLEAGGMTQIHASARSISSNEMNAILKGRADE